MNVAAHALLLLLVMLPAGHANSATLDALVAQRLSLMPQVAAWKWRRGVPIENLQRERQVLDAAEADALQRGLEVGAAQRFFALQIKAAKELQHHWFERWRAGAAVPAEVADLQRELRPQLLQLGAEILDALDRGDALSRAPVIDGLSTATATDLQRASRELTHYRDRLQQVIQSGVLRVGFTGDYPPFTFLDAGGHGEPAGVDMDLAREMAAQAGLELRWVGTSWPMLMQDLLAGRFDIGMGGISVTARRREYAQFTTPYHVGGKTPIARCDRRGDFADLASINRPDVRVIVNPGGTNERFVRDNLSRAQVLIFPDNRTIFEEIVAGRADLMITDAIEVRLQSARQPTLCPTMPGQLLTRQEKAYLLPRDETWRAEVGRWLARALERSTYATRLGAYLDGDTGRD